MARCGACQKACRTTQLAFVVDETAKGTAGGMRRARVCNACFNGAIHIVPAVTFVQKGIAPKEAEQRDAREVVKGAVKKLRGIKKARELALTSMSDPEDRGVVDGFEQAINLLEAGDF